MENLRITAVEIPFWALVWLLVKLTLAAIPAAILVAIIGGLLASAGFIGINVLNTLVP